MEIDETNGNYTLKTPEGDVEVEMQLIGLHNVYNSIGAIAAAREFFKIPLNDIITCYQKF